MQSFKEENEEVGVPIGENISKEVEIESESTKNESFAFHPEKAARIARMYERRGLTETEAMEKAVEIQKKGPLSKKQSYGTREELAVKIKRHLREYWSEARTEITAADIFTHLKEKENYQADHARGVGDLLGRHGFFLEPSNKKSGKQAYKIPNPANFPEWYDSSSFIPPEKYYSEGYFDQLMQTESGNPKSKFMKGRNNL